MNRTSTNFQLTCSTILRSWSDSIITLWSDVKDSGCYGVGESGSRQGDGEILQNFKATLGDLFQATHPRKEGPQNRRNSERSRCGILGHEARGSHHDMSSWGHQKWGKKANSFLTWTLSCGNRTAGGEIQSTFRSRRRKCAFASQTYQAHLQGGRTHIRSKRRGLSLRTQATVENHCCMRLAKYHYGDDRTVV